jgi:hypothetical protein
MPLADTLNRKPGDVLKSDDWNVIIKEIDRKINRDGADTLKGPLTIDEALNANSDVTISGNLSVTGGKLSVSGKLSVTDVQGKELIRIKPSGDVGIGTNPVASLDIASASRTGTHPTAVKGLYITGDFEADNDGVEFRHSNGTQGIGFGFNTIYAAGSNPNQDLQLKPKGTGEVKVYGKLSVTSDLIVTGNVGIGTEDPRDGLDVNGGLNVQNNGNVDLNLRVGNLLYFGTDKGNRQLIDLRAPDHGIGLQPNTTYFRSTSNFAWYKGGVHNNTPLNAGTDGKALMVIKGDGNVGIGTNNPTKAKVHIEGYQYYQQPEGYAYLVKKTGAQITGYGTDKAEYSLYASDRIIASEINAFSDERIKEIYNRSDSQEDLKTLLQIEVTDYSYRDKIAKGNGKQKKVIGQQIAKVFPQAVSTNTDVVCDIFQFATLSDGWVTLTNHGLKTGERVKLIWGEDKSEIFTIEAVTPDTFQIDLDYCGDILVYGREVNDFHVVDYDALSMLHISATQELYKIIKKLEEKINEKVKG